MSLLGIHIKVLSDDQWKAVKQTLQDAGHEIVELAGTEVDKAIAAAKATDIGAAVTADIHAMEATDKTGAEKFEAVLANTLPLVLKYVTGGGLSAVIGDVEDFGRQLVQSVFNDVKSTTAAKIAEDILSIFEKPPTQPSA